MGHFDEATSAEFHGAAFPNFSLGMVAAAGMLIFLVRWFLASWQTRRAARERAGAIALVLVFLSFPVIRVIFHIAERALDAR